MRRFTQILSGLLVLFLVACVGEIGETTSAGDEPLFELELPVEGVVDESIWRAAPEGCEGRLYEDADARRIAHAENAPGLAVVLDEEGDPVCVDTLESIAIELERLEGDPSPDPMYPKMLR